MTMGWQGWACLAALAAVAAAIGFFTHWWIGVGIFVAVVAVLAFWIGALMNTDI